MRKSSLRLLSCMFACVLAVGAAHAQQSPADTAIADAISAAERGQPVDAARFANHPLYGWLEYASLRRGIDSLPPEQAQSFLQRHQGEAVAETFRSVWLAALSRRKEWPAFLAACSPSIHDVALRCAELQAREATGRGDARWASDAQAIWASSGKPLPDSCDPVFASRAAKGGVTPELRWARIEKAATEWQPAVMRAAARGLPADQFALANDYAAFFGAVHDRALQWPKT